MDRYGIGLTEFGDWDEYKDIDGYWVKYSDVEALQKENESLMHLLKEERKERVKLEFGKADYKGVMCSKCGYLNKAKD
jgi:hypothetical protein